jgi:serine/threonine-protein kinase HipA
MKPVTVLGVSLRWGEGDEEPVGRLATRDRKIYLELADPFLASGRVLSWFLRAPHKGVIQGPDAPFSGLHGLFDDSLPDGWGRLLIHRRAAASQINPMSLTPLDMLACMGEWAMGALVYRPETVEPVDTGAIDLDQIAAQSRQVLKGAPEALFPTLLRVGGSPGGARPKAVVCRNDRSGDLIHGALVAPEGWSHWLVKFRGKDDPADIGPIEQAYAEMARTAGLTLPATRLLPSGNPKTPAYFAAQRFDRVGSAGRLHLHSACGHLHADFRQPSLDYKTLMILTFQLTKDHRQVVEMFRRAVFNVFAHNRDDHGRQFAYLMDRTGAWSLAPAYDLTHADGPSGEHSTAIMGEGRAPGERHLRAMAAEFSIPLPDAVSIIDQVRSAVDRWRDFAGESGVGRTSQSRIGAVIAPRRARRKP